MTCDRDERSLRAVSPITRFAKIIKTFGILNKLLFIPKTIVFQYETKLEKISKEKKDISSFTRTE